MLYGRYAGREWDDLSLCLASSTGPVSCGDTKLRRDVTSRHVVMGFQNLSKGKQFCGTLFPFAPTLVGEGRECHKNICLIVSYIPVPPRSSVNRPFFKKFFSFPALPICPMAKI